MWKITLGKQQKVGLRSIRVRRKDSKQKDYFLREITKLMKKNLIEGIKLMNL